MESYVERFPRIAELARKALEAEKIQALRKKPVDSSISEKSVKHSVDGDKLLFAQILSLGNVAETN